MDSSKIDRINELYHKSQSVGLTDEEKQIILDGCLMNFYAASKKR